MNQEDQSTPLEPISEEDKHEMLNVLAKDAAELDDVVGEIRDRLSEMEARSDDLTVHMNLQAAAHAEASKAFNRLEHTGTRLRAYVQHGRDFLNEWEEQKHHIAERMEQLESLRDFYENFLTAYDGLLIEIGRRKSVRKKMELAVQQATAELDHLYQGKMPLRRPAVVVAVMLGTDRPMR